VGKVKADPTSAQFATTLARQMSTVLGQGKQGLHVDGLKLDWGSLIPAVSQYSRPQLGVGAAALLRYMRLLAQSPMTVDPVAIATSFPWWVTSVVATTSLPWWRARPWATMSSPSGGTCARKLIFTSRAR